MTPAICCSASSPAAASGSESPRRPSRRDPSMELLLLLLLLLLPSKANPFLAALGAARGRAVIAEVKMGSPRLGSLAGRFDPLAQAAAYAEAGAAALSVVVEPDFFFGSYELLETCREESGLPAIAKDFVVSERQLDAAVEAGADAILLVAALYDRQELAAWAAAARRRGLAPLVETHDRRDVGAAGRRRVGARRHQQPRPARLLGRPRALDRAAARGCRRARSRVAESGIATRADVERLAAAGFDAFLIGESLLARRRPARRSSRSCSARAGPLTATLVKICGVTRVEDAVLAVELGRRLARPQLLRRRARGTSTAARARAIARRGRRAGSGSPASSSTRRSREVERRSAEVGLDLAQLHGDEPVEALERARPPAGRLLRVFRGVPAPGARSTPRRPRRCFLVDAAHATLRGGTGASWEWRRARRVCAFRRRCLVAGGIRPDNVAAALAASGAAGVDVASGRRERARASRILARWRACSWRSSCSRMTSRS